MISVRCRAPTRAMSAGQERLHPRRAAPQVEAAEHRRAFVRVELQAHRGMDAVARDQNVAVLRRQRRAAGTDEARRDAGAVLLDGDAAMAGDEILRSDPLSRCLHQDLMQLGAVDRQVRPLVSGSHAPGLAVDELAVLGEEGVVLRLAAPRAQLVLQAERAQFLDGVRAEIDADAERLDFRRGLEHPDAAGRAG